VPETDAEFTVTVGPPDKVSVNDCVAVEPTATLPKLNVLVLTVNFELWDPFAALA
jgi:hypothetical protein